MNTRILPASSAVFMAVLGLAGTFMPHEVAAAAGIPRSAALAPLFLQIAGALYLGAAMNNWMSRHSTIGGIYNRPLALGNLIHFLVVAIALVKVVATGTRDAVIIAITIPYCAFAAAFLVVTFTSPARR